MECPDGYIGIFDRLDASLEYVETRIVSTPPSSTNLMGNRSASPPWRNHGGIEKHKLDFVTDQEFDSLFPLDSLFKPPQDRPRISREAIHLGLGRTS